MKEQLKLDMLCSYLPYGLKALDEFRNIRIINWRTNTYDSRDVGLNCLLDLVDNKGIHYFKPIFHPLSELEGTEQWNEIVSEHNYPDFGHFERSVLSGHAPHRLMMELVKEHFWIYDQSYFEKGLILDINELNK